MTGNDDRPNHPPHGPIPPPVPPSQFPTVPRNPQFAPPLPPQNFYQQAPPPPGGNRKVLLVIVAFVALLLGGGGAFAAVSLLNKDDGHSSAAPAATGVPPTAGATVTVSPSNAAVPARDGDRRDLSCGSGYIVVLTSTSAATGSATVSQAFNRFPGAPDRHYLDPASSCANLNGIDGKAPLALMPYMGPFDSAVGACDARMRHLDTTTYVIGVDVNDTAATYCACPYSVSALPPLSADRDGNPTGDDRFWTLELQYMLADAGFNPDRLVPGRFGERTTQMVRDLQNASGVDPSGVMDAESWDALRAQVC